jgi:hypothetical protein
VSSPEDVGACTGCGLDLPELDAPTPAYLAASPACWTLYGRLLVREYSDVTDGLVRRLTVATYAVQHAHNSEHCSFRSTGLHLIALCLVLERGATVQLTAELLEQICGRAPAFHWLEPPAPNGTLNVSSIVAARTPDEHAQFVGR